MTERAYVLLVDDDPIQTEVGRIMLERLGCEVAIACNGLEAIELCKRRVYDLILMDQNMPVMDGPQATAAIRELAPPFRTVPIIATASTGTVHGSQQLGMDDFLGKPFTISAVKAVLANWSSGKYDRPTA